MTRADRIPSPEELWSTRRVASRLRVSEATIKRWTDEGLIACFRTPGGHRKFRPADVQSFASSHDFVPEVIEAVAPGRRGSALELVLHADTGRLFDFARRWLDAGRPLEALFDEELEPALREVGERWACGTLSVADEHVATATVVQVLARLAPLVAGPPTRGLAISACAPGERHDVASRMTALLLMSRRYRVLEPGADTPAASLLQLVQEHHPKLVVLSASTAITDRETLERDLRALARSAGKIGARVVVGGGGIPAAAPLPAGVVRYGNMRAFAEALPARR